MRRRYILPIVLVGMVSFFSSAGVVQAIEKSYLINSPHPYTNNYTNTWTISEPGATRIRVYFETIDTESGYDFVRTDAGDSWSGLRTGVWSSWKTGSSIKVTLSTDYSVTDWGFRITKIDYEKSGVTGGFTNSATTNSGFNRTSAKNYLTSYTTAPNSQYYYFGGIGGDCTSFASQVLRYGGMAFTHTAQTAPANPTIYDWYYFNSVYGTGRTATWTGAHEFRQHWADVNGAGRKRAYKYTLYTVNQALANFTTIWNDVWAGDVIQHMYADGSTYHTQIVYAWPTAPTTDITVAQHTSDEFRSLKTMLQQKQADGYGNHYVGVIQVKSGN